jgi:hypothetical protein
MALAWSKWEQKHLKQNSIDPSRAHVFTRIQSFIADFFPQPYPASYPLFLRCAKCLLHVVPQPIVAFPKVVGWVGSFLRSKRPNEPAKLSNKGDEVPGLLSRRSYSQPSLWVFLLCAFDSSRPFIYGTRLR